MNLQEELKTTEARADYHRAEALAAQMRIDTLKEKISETEKPKLRHGDYGHELHSGMPRIFLLHRSEGFIAANGQDAWSGPSEADKNILRLGNILDDLTALREDLTEFEVCSEPVYWNDDNDLCIDAAYVPEGDIDAFILNLRRMQATRKRNG